MTHSTDLTTAPATLTDAQLVARLTPTLSRAQLKAQSLAIEAYKAGDLTGAAISSNRQLAAVAAPLARSTNFQRAVDKAVRSGNWSHPAMLLNGETGSMKGDILHCLPKRADCLAWPARAVLWANDTTRTEGTQKLRASKLALWSFALQILDAESVRERNAIHASLEAARLNAPTDAPTDAPASEVTGE